MQTAVAAFMNGAGERTELYFRSSFTRKAFKWGRFVV